MSLVMYAPLQAELGVSVPLNPDAAIDLNFDSPSWERSTKIEGLHRMGSRLSVMGMEINEEAKQQTNIYLTRDEEALYIGFDCIDPDIENLYREKHTSSDEWGGWPAGDKVEVYLDGGRADSGGYFHLMVTAQGLMRETVDRKLVELGEWEAKTEVMQDRWRVVLRVPYEHLGIQKDSQGIRGIFFRDYHPHRRGSGVSERSIWGGGAVHAPGDFGEILFGDPSK